MANNKIQFKRTSTSGLLPNTTSSANASFIDAGEFAVNLTDRKVISSNGTATFEVGANLSSLLVTGSVTLNAAASVLTVGNSTVNTSINTTSITVGSNVATIGTAVYSVSNGNFGIGTSAAVRRLTVQSAAYTVAQFSSAITASPASLDAGEVFTISGTSAVSGVTFSGADPRLLTFGVTSANSVYIRANDLDIVTTNNIKFSPNNGTEAGRFVANGNFGIGTPSPKSRLQVTALNNLNAPALGNAANAPLYVTNIDSAYGLVVGTNASDGHVWLQAQRTDGTATAYNITLNEAGGNVGINNPSPPQRLSVRTAGRGIDGILVDSAATNNPWFRILPDASAGAYNNIVQAGDTLLAFSTGVVENGALSIAPWSAGNVGIRMTSTGNVGINNSSPAHLLSINGTTFLGGTVTITNSAALVANGSNGTSGQVLTSNGTGVYWGPAGSGSFSNGTAYTWSAVQTFNSNVAIAGNSTSQLLVGTTAANVTANSSSVFVSANSTQNVAINSTAVSIGTAVISSTGSGSGLNVGNTAANVTINTTAIVVQANATQNAVINATGFYVNGAAVGGGGGTSIVNGTSNVNIAAAGSNVTVAVAGSNVATFSTTSLVLGSGSGGNITGVTNVSATNLNGFVFPTAGTTSTPPIDLVAGTLTSSAVAGAIEMDSTSMFITHNTTTGRGEIGRHHQYRITADSAAIGSGITDFFPASSSLNLEASSIYEIDAQVWFLKTTAGTATWTWTFSSAASMARSYYVGTIATGFTTALVTGAPITGYVIQQTSTALAHAATASLTSAVNHHYHFKVHVWTNAATNVRLRLTQSAGTATPRAGSYYAVRKIGANAGVFA